MKEKKEIDTKPPLIQAVNKNGKFLGFLYGCDKSEIRKKFEEYRELVDEDVTLESF